MVLMPLDRQAGRGEDAGKAGAEVTIGEEDNTQAARS